MQHNNNNKKAEASDPTKKSSSVNTKMDKKSWSIIDSSFNIKKICISLLDYNKSSKFKLYISHYDIIKNTKTKMSIESLIEGNIYISEENTAFLLGMIDNLNNMEYAKLLSRSGMSLNINGDISMTIGSASIKNSIDENNFILLTENIYLKNKNYQEKHDKLTEFYFFDVEFDK